MLCLTYSTTQAQHYFTINELEKFLNLNPDYITYQLTSNGFRKPMISEESFTSADTYGNVIIIDKGAKAAIRYFIKQPSLEVYQSYYNYLKQNYEVLGVIESGIPSIAFLNNNRSITYGIDKQYHAELLNIVITGKALTNSNANKIEVYSGSPQGNIFVKVGDKISFKTTGVVRFGAFAGSGYADGIDGFTAYNKVSGFRHGSLLARIDNGDWFIVGTKASYNITREGVLTLMINDNAPDDNEGSFVVQYSISNGSNGTTNNVSTNEDNKFFIRNTNTNKSNFDLSVDKSSWTSFSLDGLNKGDYWFPGQQQGFFRITTDNGKRKVYKVEAGSKYKIEWNTTERCWDLYTDGDG